jgi:hypothetical protein
MPAVIWRSIGALRFGCYLLESPYRIRDFVLSRVGAFLLVSRNVAGSRGSNEGHDLEQVRIDLMGQSRERVGRSGDLRYTAYYTTSPDGAARLAPSERRSRPTRHGRAPRPRWPRDGSPTCGAAVSNSARYVEEVWFPNHRLELTSR